MEAESRCGNIDADPRKYNAEYALIRIRHLEFKAEVYGGAALQRRCRMCQSSSRAAHWMNRGLDRDIDLTLACLICELIRKIPELLRKEHVSHKI